MKHLAELNIGRLLHPMDDPRVAGFVDNVARINAIAERTPGFVWRNVAETSGPISGDPLMIATQSVWETVPDFERFVFGTLHNRFLERRAEWFDVLGRMHFVMWWVDPGTRPTLAEGMARLAHLEAHGDSAHAFGWTYVRATKEVRDTRRTAAE